jgi:hypothetical protein
MAIFKIQNMLYYNLMICCFLFTCYVHFTLETLRSVRPVCNQLFCAILHQFQYVFTSLKDVGIVLVTCRNIHQETPVDGNPHRVETTDFE